MLMPGQLTRYAGAVMSAGGLTPTTLRWSTLSTAGRKEGREEVFIFLALFAACGREGRSSGAMTG
jgi:hypothetical protein